MKLKKSIEIKKTRNGQGIFVTRNFSKNEVIFEVKGKLITCDEDEEIGDTIRDNTFRFDKEKYLSPQGKMGDFLNHSCEPNAKVVKSKGKLFIKSVQEIKQGEEIVIDYSTILASDDTWEMKCNCGAKGCRGVVKQFKRLPKKTREKYLELKMIPKYILS